MEWPSIARDFLLQKRRRPCRCQPTTVSGLTMRRAPRQLWDRVENPGLSQHGGTVLRRADIKPFASSARLRYTDNYDFSRVGLP